ncbi:hypothetical protein CDAR_243651 [Caerostris darwini]|uniref:Uncharacterized protein n=1 Tax=Caerostris darwini TaxID=1538125 RepID=A0AAV4VDK8_9ARAC|nr:hypothetical protein CDAR_243651 [Caerostris darwini]
MACNLIRDDDEGISLHHVFRNLLSATTNKQITGTKHHCRINALFNRPAFMISHTAIRYSESAQFLEFLAFLRRQQMGVLAHKND